MGGGYKKIVEMKLISLTLHNFQGHESLALDFNHKIISIKGPTDSGKSSILRALRWVALNDLGGDEFIREGAKKTKVVLEVHQPAKESNTQMSHIHEITRIKGSTTNTYELNGEEFKAFGQGVPSDIVNLLNVNEINFQAQHDSPFWFNETAGEVSRRLNAVVDLSVIDTTLSNIVSAVRQAQERKNVCEERLNQLKEEYGQLEGQQERVQDFSKLKVFKERLDDVTKTCDRLGGLVQQSRRNRELAIQLQEQVEDGDGVLAKGRDFLSARRDEIALVNLLTNILDREKAANPPPDFSVVEEKFNTWHDLDLQIEGLQEIIKQANERFQRVESSSRALENAEILFEKNTKGKKCPLCDQLL